MKRRFTITGTSSDGDVKSHSYDLEYDPTCSSDDSDLKIIDEMTERLKTMLYDIVCVGEIDKIEIVEA